MPEGTPAPSEATEAPTSGRAPSGHTPAGAGAEGLEPIDDAPTDDAPRGERCDARHEGASAGGRAEPPWWKRDDRRVALVLAAVSTCIVLIHATGYADAHGALGNDASSHTTTIATFARILASGDGWWSTDYNLGFPLVLYYQPLPHLFSGVVCMLLGGPERAVLTYKILSTLLIAGQPWAVYAGLRRAGFAHVEAGLAGALSPFVHNGIPFGYTPYASMVIGLYTQAWGNVALPLAMGELVRAVRGEGSTRALIATSALVATTHMFFAIALVPIVALLLGARLVERLASGESLAPLGRSLAQLVLAGVGAASALAAWLVPLSLNQAYFGGWPFGRPSRVNGYGWSGEEGLFSMIKGGHLLEGGAIPILLIASGLGLCVAAARARRTEHQALLVVVVWSALGVIGRAGLGDWIDLYPLHRSVQLFRYGALLQFGLLVAASVGIAFVARLIAHTAREDGAVLALPLVGLVFLLRATGSDAPAFGLPVVGAVATKTAMALGAAFAVGVCAFAMRTLPAAHHLRAACVTLALGVLAFPVRTGSGQLSVCFRTLPDAASYHDATYRELTGWLRELPKDGRLYAGPKSGTRGHFHGGLLAYHAQRAGGQSYGVGLHDSLHFYTLEYFRLDANNEREERNTLALADLYDFRYVAANPSERLRGLEPFELLHESARYRVLALDVSGQSVALMGDGGTIHGTPRGARPEIRRWLNGNGPELGITRELRVDDPRDREGLTSAPRGIGRDDRFTLDPDLRVEGDVLRSEAHGASVQAEVVLEEPGFIVAKVGYHPFWRAWLNGEEVETTFVFPGFVAVRADAGAHTFEARYRWPAYTRWLLLGMVFALGLGVWDDRRRDEKFR